MKTTIRTLQLLMALLLFLPALALAEDDASTGLTILHTALEIGLAAIMSFVGVVLMPMLKRFLAEKITNETFEGISLRLSDAVFASVREVEQAYVKAVKAGRAPDSPGGEKLTREEMERASDAALAAVKRHLGPHGWSKLKAVLGLDGDAEAEEVVRSHIEAEVHETKRPTAG